MQSLLGGRLDPVGAPPLSASVDNPLYWSSNSLQGSRCRWPAARHPRWNKVASPSSSETPSLQCGRSWRPWLGQCWPALAGALGLWGPSRHRPCWSNTQSCCFELWSGAWNADSEFQKPVPSECSPLPNCISPPLTKTCKDAWSGEQGSMLRGAMAFAAVPHGTPVFINLFP